MIIKETIQRGVDDLGLLQAWNHKFELPYGIQTQPGIQKSYCKNLVKLDRLITCV